MKTAIAAMVALCSFVACPNSAKASSTTVSNKVVKAEAPAKQNESGDTSFENGVLTVNGVRYEFALVKGGTFTMGAGPEVTDAEDCEKPARQVTINQNYYIGKTEVTAGFWKAVTGKYPEGFGEEDANKPVDNVSMDDVLDFLEYLQFNFGPIFTLPSSEEWEYAARGGNKSRHYIYSGSNTLTDVAWNEEGNIVVHAYDVATKKPNELGIYDMSGNVWEWCHMGDKDVLRGGNINCYEGFCRVSYYKESPDASAFKDRFPAMTGFRLCVNENWEEALDEGI
jgi:formylglycine-generating enzyme required for sulfatase activity